jgi:hypothetical protein
MGEKISTSPFNKEEPMRLKHFTLPLAYLSFLLLWLGVLSAPVAAQPERGFFLVTFDRPEPVTVHHADGSISRAEFVAEFIFYPDGRANGGWGLRGLGTAPAPALTLYRVVAGQLSSNNILTLTGQRLSPLPAEEITIRLQPSPAGQSAVPPAGSVRFLVDMIPSADGEPISFVTEGQVLPPPPSPTPTLTDFVIGNFVYINAPPQTVVVQTPSGSYTAYFTNVALIFPSGAAIGSLTLAEPEGSTAESNQGFGRWEIFAGRVLSRFPEGKYLLLRARPLDTKHAAGGEITIILRPGPDPSEPPKYWVFGTELPPHFEAQTSVVIF